MSLQNAPEIEAKVRDEAEARGVSIDVVLNEAVQFLRKSRETPRAVRRVGTYKDRSREIAWAAKPDPRYLNQWVVLDGDNVVAHGMDAKTVYDDARSKGIATPFMHFVAEPDPSPFFIGWLSNH